VTTTVCVRVGIRRPSVLCLSRVYWMHSWRARCLPSLSARTRVTENEKKTQNIELEYQVRSVHEIHDSVRGVYTQAKGWRVNTSPIVVFQIEL
jgi:hypothetical protein